MVKKSIKIAKISIISESLFLKNLLKIIHFSLQNRKCAKKGSKFIVFFSYRSQKFDFFKAWIIRKTSKNGQKKVKKRSKKGVCDSRESGGVFWGVFYPFLGRFLQNLEQISPRKKKVSPFIVEKGRALFFCQPSSEKHATLQYKYYIGVGNSDLGEFSKKKA
jgi:hypothetical protein